MNECGRGRECAKCAFVTLEFPEIQSNGHTTIVCYLLQFSACLVKQRAHLLKYISSGWVHLVRWTVVVNGLPWSMAIHPVLFWSLIHSLQHYREGVCLNVCPDSSPLEETTDPLLLLCSCSFISAADQHRIGHVKCQTKANSNCLLIGCCIPLILCPLLCPSLDCNKLWAWLVGNLHIY